MYLEQLFGARLCARLDLFAITQYIAQDSIMDTSVPIPAADRIRRNNGSSFSGTTAATTKECPHQQSLPQRSTANFHGGPELSVIHASVQRMEEQG